jgi:uncharacterized damage-inducible protein DinB
MSVSPDVLIEHLTYTAWASKRLVHAVELLSPEHLNYDFQTSERTILRTLVHVFAADRIWFSRIQDETLPAFVSEADYDLHVLQIDWPLLQEKWLDWARELTPEGAEQLVGYKDLKGNPYATRASEIVLHVVNHGTHHRGQVSGFMRALGHTPPQLDLIRYYREAR